MSRHSLHVMLLAGAAGLGCATAAVAQTQGKDRTIPAGVERGIGSPNTSTPSGVQSRPGGVENRPGGVDSDRAVTTRGAGKKAEPPAPAAKDRQDGKK